MTGGLRTRSKDDETFIRVIIEVKPDGSVTTMGVDEPLRVDADNVADLFDKVFEMKTLRNCHPVHHACATGRCLAADDVDVWVNASTLPAPIFPVRSRVGRDARIGGDLESSDHHLGP